MESRPLVPCKASQGVAESRHVNSEGLTRDL